MVRGSDSALLLLLAAVRKSRDADSRVVSEDEALVGRADAEKTNQCFAARDAGAKRSNRRGRGEEDLPDLKSRVQRSFKPIEWLNAGVLAVLRYV